MLSLMLLAHIAKLPVLAREAEMSALRVMVEGQSQLLMGKGYVLNATARDVQKKAIYPV